MSNNVEARPSLIKSLLGSERRRKRAELDEEADRELDMALVRLSLAFEENGVATDAVRRRQSSGSLKIVSIPAAAGAENT